MQANSRLFTDLGDDDVSLHKTGVLPSQTIREYIEAGFIKGAEPIEEFQVQPASIDLRLGSVAYELRSSFLPGGYSHILSKVDDLKLCIRKVDLTHPTVFRPGNVYLVELMEEVWLPAKVRAKANARSTTGRTDIFTRLVCDFSTEFDEVPPGYGGKLYAEVVPRTFAIQVQRGTRVNQLRFIRGNPPHSDKKISDVDRAERLTYSRDQDPVPATIRRGVLLSVDLAPENASGIVGYRAKRSSPVVDFDCVACHDRLDFWDEIRISDLRSLVLEPEDFYILKSRERVRIPPTHAAELDAFDPSFGEFRVHYAGFLDPGFGYGEGDVLGTPVVLEVRARDVPFLIEDGQPIARLQYHRLLEAADKSYGSTIGSSYQVQGTGLGKQFR